MRCVAVCRHFVKQMKCISLFNVVLNPYCARTICKNTGKLIYSQRCHMESLGQLGLSKIKSIFICFYHFHWEHFAMNRFEYGQAVLRDDESFVVKHKSMKLYHGHQKVMKCTKLLFHCEILFKNFILMINWYVFLQFDT